MLRWIHGTFAAEKPQREAVHTGIIALESHGMKLRSGTVKEPKRDVEKRYRGKSSQVATKLKGELQGPKFPSYSTDRQAAAWPTHSLHGLAEATTRGLDCRVAPDQSGCAQSLPQSPPMAPKVRSAPATSALPADGMRQRRANAQHEIDRNEWEKSREGPERLRRMSMEVKITQPKVEEVSVEEIKKEEDLDQKSWGEAGRNERSSGLEQTSDGQVCDEKSSHEQSDNKPSDFRQSDDEQAISKQNGNVPSSRPSITLSFTFGNIGAGKDSSDKIRSGEADAEKKSDIEPSKGIEISEQESSSESDEDDTTGADPVPSTMYKSSGFGSTSRR